MSTEAAATTVRPIEEEEEIIREESDDEEEEESEEGEESGEEEAPAAAAPASRKRSKASALAHNLFAATRGGPHVLRGGAVLDYVRRVMLLLTNGRVLPLDTAMYGPASKIEGVIESVRFDHIAKLKIPMIIDTFVQDQLRLLSAPVLNEAEVTKRFATLQLFCEGWLSAEQFQKLFVHTLPNGFELGLSGMTPEDKKKTEERNKERLEDIQKNPLVAKSELPLSRSVFGDTYIRRISRRAGILRITSPGTVLLRRLIATFVASLFGHVAIQLLSGSKITIDDVMLTDAINKVYPRLSHVPVVPVRRRAKKAAPAAPAAPAEAPAAAPVAVEVSA